ncbi:choice-of-anchor A family protein [Teredinibacter turnerae]|uniref:choice-of-anchor A family protein n=1 Tax=Teredinibacter turnerae TaxID=2426 RepID=UPI00040CA298|nr:choice-of-anchor A family protein [Teredinibacter turnerae]
MLSQMNNTLTSAFLFFAIPAVASAAELARVDLGNAADYNLVLFGNFSSPYYGSIEGRLAVEGDVNLENYGAVTQLNEQAGVSMVVGGDLNFRYGKVYDGHILVSGSADGVGTTVRNGLTQNQHLLDGVDSVIDFNHWEQTYIELAQVTSELPTNGTVLSQWGGLYLTGDCSSNLQVFALDGQELNAAHTFQVSCIPEGAAVIFNISGATAGMSYMDLQTVKPYRDRVLFNFYQATALTLTSIGVEGSVLAPMADVLNPTGQLNGTVIAKSWNGPMNLNYVRFAGYNTEVIACEGEAPTDT